jgi:PAS domain S-box-containing protein
MAAPRDLPEDARAVYDDDKDVYRTLLESTKAIPWKIDWASMRFAYVGPQIEAVLGWPHGSWLTVNDWAERIHPEDRQQTVDFCVAQSQQGVDHEADYRALTPEGDYVWIRDVVHVVRKPDGSVDCLVGFMFDISERKRNEDKIVQLQKELEALSYRDALTGIANRRMFDSMLEVELGQGTRDRGAAVADHRRHRFFQAVQRLLRPSAGRHLPEGSRTGAGRGRRARA